VKRAVRAVLREPLLYKDFLCCGNSAVIEFLLQAGLYDEARTRAAMMSERAVRNGHFNCLSPNVQEIFSPSLFYGAAGIGYEMLRIMAPDQTLSAYP